jgi:CDP-glucose 4,6-dehydratase
LGFRQGTLENMAVTAAPQTDFWRGKRVLVTGHSGFKGSWLTLALHRSGAKVTGISLPPLTTPSLFAEAKIGELCASHFFDIRDAAGVAGLIRAARPEIVFHLAAQPLVRESYRDPLTTFETNVMGTANVLEALRGIDGVRVAVMVTTDKVYRTAEVPGLHHEDDPLGGHDPYSASKAASEMVIESYRQSYLAEQPVAPAMSSVAATGPRTVSFLMPSAPGRRARRCGFDGRTRCGRGSTSSSRCQVMLCWRSGCGNGRRSQEPTISGRISARR